VKVTRLLHPLVLAAIVIVGSCASPRRGSCKVTCSEGVCPEGFLCLQDGYCHASEQEDLCTTAAEDGGPMFPVAPSAGPDASSVSGPDAMSGTPDAMVGVVVDAAAGPGDPCVGAIVGQPCDGSDGDLCAEGVTNCGPGGTIVCTDSTPTNDETCDAIDNDCDMQVDEGCCGNLTCDPTETCSSCPGDCGGCTGGGGGGGDDDSSGDDDDDDDDG
jgi:hypothetical protein